MSTFINSIKRKLPDRIDIFNKKNETDFVNMMKDLMVQLRADKTAAPSPVAPGQTLDSSLQSLNILA